MRPRKYGPATATPRGEPGECSKPSRKPIPMLNQLIVDLIRDAVIGDESYKVGGGVLSLGFDVLLELGLVREDREGDIGATPRLLHLFAEAYYDRRAKAGKPKATNDRGA